MNARDLFNGILRDHAAAQAAVAAKADTYRGWKIYQGRWPEPEWMATHPNYDASWEGEEDGWVDNGLAADAATYAALLDEIDAIQDEWEEARGHSGDDK